MSAPSLPDDVDALVEGWLDGILDAAAERRLAALLSASPAVATRLARATLVHDRLRDLFRADDGGVSHEPPSSSLRRRVRRRTLAWMALPAALAATLLVAIVMGRSSPATAAAALEGVARAGGVGDREYRVHVLDHGPAGPMIVETEAGGRKPGVDGARLFVRGSDRFVLERSFGDGTRFVNGCDGAIGWSVPPTGHVHLSGDVARFRRGIPGEGADVPFIALPENLLGLRRGYRLRLEAALPDRTRRLVAEREGRRRGPARVTIRFDAEGTPLEIVLEGLREGLEWVDRPGEPTEGPDRVALELVSRADLAPDFFAHDHHHAPDRPLDWE